MEIKTPMYAAVDTPTCRRRSELSPLTFLNPRKTKSEQIITFLLPKIEKKGLKELLIVKN